MTKDLHARLDAIKELKTQYYIGSKAAHNILKSYDSLYKIRETIEAKISQIGENTAKIPSVFELEEAIQAYKKIRTILVTSYSDADIQRKLISLYDCGFGSEEEQFAEAYISIRVAEPEEEKSMHLSLASLQTFLALDEKHNLELKKRKRRTGYDVFDRITTIMEKFSKGDYRQSRVKETLFWCDIEGCGPYDNIYDRLEREQITHQDSMQRLALTRYAFRHGCESVEEIEDSLTVTSDIDGRDDKEQRELKFLQNAVRRHRRFLEKYLES